MITGRLNRRVWIAAIAAVSGSALGSAFAETTVVPSPWQIGEVRADGAGIALVAVADPFAALADERSVILEGFPIEADRSVSLDLRQFDAFATDARLVEVIGGVERPIPSPLVALFAGEVLGTTGSRVFLSVRPNAVEGYIILDSEWFVVSSGPPRERRDPAVYRPDRLPEGVIDWYAYACEAITTDAIDLPAGADSDPDARSAVCRLANVAIETDHQYWQLFDSSEGATAYAATIYGAMTEIYTAAVNVRLEIGYLRLWPERGDPWNMRTTGEQLDQYVAYWNANMTHIPRHVAHFLSGRSLGGGVAYVGAVCSGTYGYGLSANLGGFFPYPIQHNSPQNWDLMVVSHETGHNFGAPHTHDMDPQIDNCAGGDCSVTPNGTIMSYCHLCPGGLANVRMEFHERIISERILPFVRNTQCGLRVDRPTIDVGPSNADLCEGSALQLTVQASDVHPLTYQWRKNQVDIPGATDETLVITGVSTADGGSYDVVVSNLCRSQTSDPAVVTVCVFGEPADLTGDCTIDVSDLSVVLSHFGAPGTGEEGDLDGDGEVTIADVAQILAHFGETCWDE